jgi:hypothetical protein
VREETNENEDYFLEQNDALNALRDVRIFTQRFTE